MTISVHRVDTMFDDDATTMKRWAPFSQPDNFDVANATLGAALKNFLPQNQ